MSKSDDLGWGAVVFPELRTYQPVLVLPHHREQSKVLDNTMKLIMSNAAGTGITRIGALTAVFAEFAITNPQAPQLGGAAYLIGEEFGHPYWWIEAFKKEQGTATSIYKLEANSPEEAAHAFGKVGPMRMMDIAQSFEDLIRSLKEARNKP